MLGKSFYHIPINNLLAIASLWYTFGSYFKKNGRKLMEEQLLELANKVAALESAAAATNKVTAEMYYYLTIPLMVLIHAGFLAYEMGADAVEIHTGKYCDSKDKKLMNKELDKIKKSAFLLNLKVWMFMQDMD